MAEQKANITNLSTNTKYIYNQPNNKSNSKLNSKINTPSLNNKSKNSIAIENNQSIKQNQGQNQDKNNKSTNSLQTGKEDAASVYEIAADNYMILLGITVAIVIIIIIYFFSQTFRVDRAINRMEIYGQYQHLSSLDYSVFGNKRIGDYYVSSAYNAAHSGYQMFDYTSEKIVLSVLQSGARYLEFNVFNNEYGSNAYPVVSMGYKSGEWKMMVNDTPLETILDTISNNAFKVFDGKEGVDNPDDPLFIGLNLNTNSNLDCLNLTAYLITKYFSDRLLPNTYGFQNSDNLADAKMSQLIGKVIIFSSDGFQGSGLEEIVNYSWDNTDNNPNHSLQRLHYSKLIAPGFNTNDLIEFNRKGFTIIVPHQEGDILNTNFNPMKAIELGCQFIAMEFQYIDSNMDYYITKFQNKSFIMKDTDLLAGNTNSTKPMTTSALTI
jgi:hypothetical protein